MQDASKFATYPSLRERVVIVTGGASGIGASIVESFAQQHARVAFLDIQDDAAQQVIDRCGRCGHIPPVFYPCDVTNTALLQSTISAVESRFTTIDVLVNNAGNDTRHTVEGVTPESWDQSIALNLKHQFFASQAVLPAMRRARRGSIVNLSSISWMIPSTNVPVYVTAKAAIVGMTRTLAHEVGPDNIRVNCVLPGAILTERQQKLWLTESYKAEILSNQALKRLLMPEEVAKLILFLASDDSSGITNQSHIIDAGWA